MAAHPFSAPTVLRNIDASLPTGAENSPQLKTPHDAIAIFVHACMLSVGFRLIGLSEDDRLGTSPQYYPSPPQNTTTLTKHTETPIEGTSPQPLPQNWNASPGAYGFRYAHAQSSLQYLIKVNRLGNKTVIMGLGLGDDKTASFDLVTKDFLSESFFPYTLHPTPIPQQQPLENGFISASRITDLASLIKISIVQKLIPGLSKPGYTEDPTAATAAAASSSRQPRNEYDDPLRVGPRPYHDPLRYPPRPGHPPIPAGGERPPGFDDDYEILSPPRGYGSGSGGRNPLSIGDDDLNPPGLGPGAPLRGPFFGEGRPGFGGMGPMGGMHPTGDHPMFGGGGEGVPDLRFPPGARYDPVGPGDAPMGGLRGPRGPGRGGPGPGGFGGFGGYGGYGGGDFI